MSALPKKQQADLWIAMGVVVIAVGLLFLGILSREMPRYSALRSNGLLVEGYITDKNIETRRTRKGSSSANYYLTVEFNAKNAKPISEVVPKVKSKNPIDNLKFGYIGKTPGADTSSKINVERAVYERLLRGSAVDVVFLAESPAEARLAERVREYSPWPLLSFSLVMLTLGIGLVVVGRRKRTEAQSLELKPIHLGT